MTSAPPLDFAWNGSEMIPRHPKLADRYFVVGQTYRLEPREDRSSRSHAHYFAALHEAWLNLPAEWTERFPSEDHLRKYALIKTGFCDQRTFVCSSKAEARRLLPFIAQMDQYAVVTVSETVVTVYTARSQSMRAMGKKPFGESKEAVLDYVASLIGTTSDALAKNASEAT